VLRAAEPVDEIVADFLASADADAGVLLGVTG
jgi:hypothetical protein